MKLAISILIILSLILYLSLPSRKNVPVPSYPETNQPNCGVGTLSMLAAEILNKDISPQQWNITVDSTYGVPIETLSNAWYNIAHATLTRTFDVKFNKPYLWVGTFQGGSHACICYLLSNYVILKHSTYDPNTKTNYMVQWTYQEFISNTTAMYIP